MKDLHEVFFHGPSGPRPSQHALVACAAGPLRLPESSDQRCWRQAFAAQGSYTVLGTICNLRVCCTDPPTIATAVHSTEEGSLTEHP